jgi:hypothetical protein
MLALIAAEWDADGDPSRPTVGARVNCDGLCWLIGKVDWISGGDFLAQVVGGKEPNPAPYDKILLSEHPSRMIIWRSWVTEV